MPQLVKGGKWVFGWVVAGPAGDLPIPPEAWDEYGFQGGEEGLFLPGSRRSGGFGLGTPRLLSGSRLPFGDDHLLGRAQIASGRRVPLPTALGVPPGTRLLAVRGSGFALGFVARGPIYEEALRHGALAVFE